MQAVVYSRYGMPDRLELQDVERPMPKDDEVLIRVHATSLNTSDKYMLMGKPFILRLSSGLSKPKHPILGADVAGRVEAVGKDITQFQIGDEVYGDLSERGRGGLAEYVCAREDVIAHKPANMTFEEAAALPLAGITALQALRDKGQIGPGKMVLINGASGGVGTFAVQIAKAFGAEVTAVCSTGKLEQARALGADHVIDYTQEDFTKKDTCYDLIFAVNGYQPIAAYKRALCSEGIYVAAGGSMAQIFQGMLLGSLVARGSGKTMGSFLARPNSADLTALKALVEAGKVVPSIEKHYTLSEAPEAMWYLCKGHVKGKLVISVLE